MSTPPAPPPAAGAPRIPIQPAGKAAQRPVPISVVEQADARPPGLGWLMAAPHRLFFFLAMLGLVTVSLWWLAHLVARSAGVALPIAVPPSWVHGWAMASGFIPLFIFGFLFTAGPKWLNLDGPPAAPLLPGALLSSLGIVGVLVGAALDARVTAAATALVALGWLLMFGRFALPVRRSRAPDRLHATLVLVFGLFGVVGQVCYAVGFAQTELAWVHTGEMLLLWWFIAPVYVTVAHRLIPFFTSSALPFFGAWRPSWVLTALLVVVVGHALLLLPAQIWPTPSWGVLRAALDAAGGLLVLYVAWRWGAVQSLKNRLLAMLHIGFSWLGVALLLYAAGQVALLAGRPDLALGQAPLHALTMGFFGSVMVAMVTRVTAGHSGRKLVADDLVWALYWLLQAATVLRVAADALPALRNGTLLVAIVAWCLALVPWALRSLPAYLSVRADRRPG